MNARGHNERSYRLDELANAARAGLKRVDGGEYEAILGWVDYGIALNEGRSLFPGDKEFGEWMAQWQVAIAVEPHERAAAMWAAANADQLAEAQEASKARTLRGLHAKWKEIESERKAEAERLERVAQAQAEEAAGSPPRGSAAASVVTPEPEGGSRPDQQHRTIPDPLEGKGEGAVQAPECAPPPAPDQEPDPDAKLRAEYRALADEAREAEWIEYRKEIAENRKRIARQTSEIADLRKAVKDLSEGSDMGKALSAKIRELQAVKLARDNALTAAKREEYKRRQAEARVKELEQAGVAY